MLNFNDLDLEYEDLVALIETATAAGRLAAEGFVASRDHAPRVDAYRRMMMVQAELIVALGIEMTPGEISAEWILDAIEMEQTK